MLGCDYLEPIKGVGPKSALKMIREFGSLEKVIESLREKYAPCLHNRIYPLNVTFRAAAKEEAAGDDGKKKKGGIQIPEEWPWEQAKKVFETPDVTPADQIEVGFRDTDKTSRALTCGLARLEEPRR